MGLAGTGAQTDRQPLCISLSLGEVFTVSASLWHTYSILSWHLFGSVWLKMLN